MFVLDAIHCWDNEELEIFDLVEEVNTNFYTLLGVPEVNGFTFPIREWWNDCLFFNTFTKH